MRKLYIKTLYTLYKTCDWLRGKLLSAMIKAAASKTS